jgi:hypothetical protein
LLVLECLTLRDATMTFTKFPRSISLANKVRRLP